MRSAAEPFEARYSVMMLGGWVLLAVPLIAASAWLFLHGVADGGPFAIAVGAVGILFFGGIAVMHLANMFDRKVQLRIDGQGLFLRAHSDTPIPLRSIKAYHTDMGRLSLILFKPSKYPITRTARRLIYRLNGTAARGFFGDAWIWTAFYDCTLPQVLEAIDAHRPMSAFEQRLAETAGIAESEQEASA